MLLDIQKAIFWARFIEVASCMYAPGVTNPPQPVNFPVGWNIVKNINAEAIAGLLDQKEFMGFVAQSAADTNKFAIVFHGTDSIADFLDDFEFMKIDFQFIANGGKTEYGFTRFYESMTFVNPVSGETQSLKEYVSNLPQNASFTVAGHSLGAALATLHAAVLAEKGILVEAYTYASPMVGDEVFANTYNSLLTKSYRIFNKPDIVPQLPGALLGYEHVSTPFEVNSLNDPEIKRSILGFHSLESYIHSLKNDPS
jgi:hypothetical protein